MSIKVLVQTQIHDILASVNRFRKKIRRLDIASTIATSIAHSKLDYCNSLYENLPVISRLTSSFTCQLISVIIITLVIHHSFTLSQQAQTYLFNKSFSP